MQQPIDTLTVIRSLRGNIHEACQLLFHGIGMKPSQGCISMAHAAELRSQWGATVAAKWFVEAADLMLLFSYPILADGWIRRALNVDNKKRLTASFFLDLRNSTGDARLAGRALRHFSDAQRLCGAAPETLLSIPRDYLTHGRALNTPSVPDVWRSALLSAGLGDAPDDAIPLASTLAQAFLGTGRSDIARAVLAAGEGTPDQIRMPELNADLRAMLVHTRACVDIAEQLPAKALAGIEACLGSPPSLNPSREISIGNQAALIQAWMTACPGAAHHTADHLLEFVRKYRRDIPTGARHALERRIAPAVETALGVLLCHRPKLLVNRIEELVVHSAWLENAGGPSDKNSDDETLWDDSMHRSAEPPGEAVAKEFEGYRLGFDGGSNLPDLLLQRGTIPFAASGASRSPIWECRASIEDSSWREVFRSAGPFVYIGIRTFSNGSSVVYATLPDDPRRDRWETLHLGPWAMPPSTIHKLILDAETFDRTITKAFDAAVSSPFDPEQEQRLAQALTNALAVWVEAAQSVLAGPIEEIMGVAESKLGMRPQVLIAANGPFALIPFDLLQLASGESLACRTSSIARSMGFRLLQKALKRRDSSPRPVYDVFCAGEILDKNAPRADTPSEGPPTCPDDISYAGYLRYALHCRCVRWGLKLGVPNRFAAGAAALRSSAGLCRHWVLAGHGDIWGELDVGAAERLVDVSRIPLSCQSATLVGCYLGGAASKGPATSAPGLVAALAAEGVPVFTFITKVPALAAAHTAAEYVSTMLTMDARQTPSDPFAYARIRARQLERCSILTGEPKTTLKYFATAVSGVYGLCGSAN